MGLIKAVKTWQERGKICQKFVWNAAEADGGIDDFAYFMGEGNYVRYRGMRVQLTTIATTKSSYDSMCAVIRQFAYGGVTIDNTGHYTTDRFRLWDSGSASVNLFADDHRPANEGVWASSPMTVNFLLPEIDIHVTPTMGVIWYVDWDVKE